MRRRELVSAFAILLIAAVIGLGGCGKGESPVQGADAFVLQADCTDFLIGQKQKAVFTTLVSQEVAGGQVEVRDVEGKTYAVLQAQETVPDGRVRYTGTAQFDVQQAACFQVVACAGKTESAPLTLTFTPPLTQQDIQAGRSVMQELENKLPADADKDALLDRAEAYLKADARVKRVKREKEAVHYWTQAGVQGMYTPPFETGLLGSGSFATDTDETEAFTQLNMPENFYSDSGRTRSNDNVLVLRPDDKLTLFKHHREYGQKLADALGGSMSFCTGEQVFESIYNGDWAKYGTIVLNTHGNCQFTHPDGSVMCAFLVMPELKDTQIYLYDKWYTQSYFGDYAMEDASAKLILGINGNVWVTTEYIMSVYQSRYFDNALFYFGACYVAGDVNFDNFLFEHGAKAVVGYNYAVWEDVERTQFKAMIDAMITKAADGTRTLNLQEMVSQKTAAVTLYRTLFAWPGESNQVLVVTPEETFSYWGKGNLSGRVEQPDEEGRVVPVENATVYAMRYRNGKFVDEAKAKTDVQGGFSFQGLQWGSYLFFVDSVYGEKIVSFCFDEASADGGVIQLAQRERVDVEAQLKEYLQKSLIPQYGVMNTAPVKIPGSSSAQPCFAAQMLSGILGAQIQDLDGDGQLEMLTVCTQTGLSTQQPGETALIMQVYEYDREKKVFLADTRQWHTPSYALAYHDARTSVFTYDYQGEIFIGLHHYFEMNDTADTIWLYVYNGEKFSFSHGGSIFLGGDEWYDLWEGDEEPVEQIFAYTPSSAWDTWKRISSDHRGEDYSEQNRKRYLESEAQACETYRGMFELFGLSHPFASINAGDFHTDEKKYTPALYAPLEGNLQMIAGLYAPVGFDTQAYKRLERVDGTGLLDAYR